MDKKSLQEIWSHHLWHERKIVIEITEQSLLRSNSQMHENITALRRRGALIALDDVGGGAVSLRDAAAFKPDYIKLDRSCIQEVDCDTSKQHIFTSLLYFCQSIGARVVAEGVETEAELNFIRGYDIDLLQGYFIGFPSEAIVKDISLPQPRRGDVVE